MPINLKAAFATLILPLCLWACVGTRSVPHPHLVRETPPTPATPMAGEFWVVADTQLHNVTALATKSRSAMTDKIAHVAIRPPSLDLWSEVVLASVLEHIHHEGHRAPLLFLGDAANISCLGEFTRFLDTMHGSTWFGVLGNHDGYYMGNFTYKPDFEGSTPESQTWQGACNNGGLQEGELKQRISVLERELLLHGQGQLGLQADQGTMTKTHAVWLYLDDLNKRGIISKDPLDKAQWVAEDGRLVFKDDGSYEVDGQHYQVSIIAAIPALRAGDAPRAWQAYVLQGVELPGGAHALLLDTSDYLNMPPSTLLSSVALLQNFTGCRHSGIDNSLPGECGEVNVHQLAQAKALMEQWRMKGQSVFLLGHHPWQDLRLDTANRLQDLLAEPQFVAYLSAHTHFPGATAGYEGKGQWELNIGSTTDWPMEFAHVGYEAGGDSEAATRLLVDLRRLKEIQPGGGATCPYVAEGEAHAAKKEADTELDYDTVPEYTARALDVYAKVLRAIPASERDVLDTAASKRACPAQESCISGLAAALKIAEDAQTQPLYAKVEALSRLIEFDRSVLRQSAWVTQAETRCAIWASELEFKKHGAKSGALKNSERLPLGPGRFRVEQPSRAR